MSALVPTVTVLMLLIGTSTGRTRPSSCYSNGYSSSSPLWQCGDGYCIERYYVCDGEFDCLNGTDEFNCVICRGNSFHCNNKRCIVRLLHCSGIDECGDGSDEPWSCSGSINYNDFLKNTYGGLFGYVAGIIVLIFGIVTAIGAMITVCACKRSCPLYKWRKRRQEPPVGVIVAEPNQLYQDDATNLPIET